MRERKKESPVQPGTATSRAMREENEDVVQEQGTSNSVELDGAVSSSTEPDK